MSLATTFEWLNLEKAWVWEDALAGDQEAVQIFIGLLLFEEVILSVYTDP